MSDINKKGMKVIFLLVMFSFGCDSENNFRAKVLAEKLEWNEVCLDLGVYKPTYCKIKTKYGSYCMGWSHHHAYTVPCDVIFSQEDE